MKVLFLLATISTLVLVVDGANEVSNTFIQHRSLVTTQNFTCQDGASSPQCSYNGYCVISASGSTCVCDKDYTTFEAPENLQCNYHQKSTLTAFLLELFLGKISGAGYWYLGRYVLAIVQLILCWGGGIVIRLLGCVCPVPSMLYRLWILGMTAFWLYAVITIGMGDVNDGNGAPIRSL